MFVVVADNQSVFQKILAETLSQQGVEYCMCNSGAQVLQAIEQRPVDLFVTTMNLPDITGADLCRKIRAAIQDDCIPIIILTSEPRGQSFAEAFEAGATDIFRRNKIQYFSDYLLNLSEISKPLEGRVMVVEDSQSQRQLLQQTLIDWGLQVDSFQDCDSALQAHRAEPYDVILTDIELNGIENGLDLVHEVRQLQIGVGDVPIIAVTAYLSESTRVNFLARGIDRCMLKPILLPELRSEIKKQMDARKAKLALEYERRLERKKSQAKTEFMARMSHELRTSLNAIIGFSDLISMTKNGDTEVHQYADKIHDAGKLLLELINEMLDLSQIETGNIKLNLQSVKLQTILEKCQQVMFSYAKQHQIALSMSNKLSDVYIRCDIIRLTEVLLNLISNAIKYNNPGGKIKISTEITASDLVRISVKDSGIGISADRACEIFQPFARVHEGTHQAQGTGIGLAIAKQLVELMGGILNFKSELGKGSTFWLEIPQGSASDAIQGPVDEGPQSLLPCKVLYVDDNPVNCLLLEKWFAKQPGTQLVVCRSARECLESLKGEHPDLVLTDINMPGENGFWLLKAIRKHYDESQLPVIALSAMAMDDEVQRGTMSGFSAYLTKPFEFNVLCKTINQLLLPAILAHQAKKSTRGLSPELHQ